MNVTVMSFNTQHCMNYVTKKIDFDIMAEAIRTCGADVIGLNEMRDAGTAPEYTAQVKELADRLGYYFYFAKAIELEGQNPYGNALLSRFPLLSVETIPIPDPAVKVFSGYYETRCVLKAKLDVAGGLTVLAAHFGLNPDEQLHAVQTVVQNLTEKQCVVMGDFNMQPEDPLLMPLRDRLFDTAECFTEEKLSFPSDVPDRKIDYIFTSRDLKVQSADIPAIVASDHRPHTAVLEL